MTMYKVRYNIELETLTPVVISAGGEFSYLRHGYKHFVNGGFCSRFDGTIIDYLSTNDLIEILKNYEEKNQKLSYIFPEYARKYKDKAKQLHSEVKDTRSYFNCFSFVTDVKGKETPIIPGSALKGSFTYFNDTKTSNEKEIDKGHLWSFPDIYLSWDNIFVGNIIVKKFGKHVIAGINHEMLKPRIKINFHVSTYQDLDLRRELKNAQDKLKMKIYERIKALNQELRKGDYGGSYEMDLKYFINVNLEDAYLLQLGKGIMAEDPKEALKDKKHNNKKEYRTFREVNYMNRIYRVLGMCKIRILKEERI